MTEHNLSVRSVMTTNMTKEQAKDQLIELLYEQVIQLSMMSKIELGDDVITEYQRLNKIINDTSNR